MSDNRYLTCGWTVYLLGNPIFIFVACFTMPMRSAQKNNSPLKIKLKKPRDVKGGPEGQCWCACADTVENH